MILTKNDLRGKIENLPLPIAQKALEYTIAQNNIDDLQMLDSKDYLAHLQNFGIRASFVWSSTKEGHNVWSDISNGNLNGFFEIYPEITFPCLMEVSDTEDFNKTAQRVVIAKNKRGYLAWAYAETIEDAQNQIDATLWKFARPIVAKISKKQIADLFGYKLNEFVIID